MADRSRAGAAPPAPTMLVEHAFAKINLTLRVLGRRADGYHDIESLVCFAPIGDRLTFTPGGPLALRVRGPRAVQAGAVDDNLVLKAVRAISTQIAGLALGRFDLVKRLPAQAGLGGGSADAAAALRLIARANGLSADDPRLYAAARMTGADVPVCLDPQPRIMRGVGEVLSEPLALPRLAAVLVHPGIALATRDVFAALVLSDRALPDRTAPRRFADRAALLDFLQSEPNDLETPAIKLAPAIATLLAELRVQAGCRLARMSGSGSACFGIFTSRSAARLAAKAFAAAHPGWWVRVTDLGAVGR